MTLFNQLLNSINNFLYEYILILLLVAVGIYFTIRTGFVQISMLGDAFKTLKEKKEGDKGVSSFQALMISTASCVGTGNIAGVATALAAGGPGAIFWMWLLAIIGSASAFIESTLAQIYKIKDGSDFRGGPAYYIERGLKKRWLGIVFAILLIACFAFGFNALQSYNVSSAFEYYTVGDDVQRYVAFAVGLILAVATAYVIFGGIHRIGIITSYLVPIMAILYIILGLYITLSNIGLLPQIFKTIFSNALDVKAISGGFGGSCVMYGIKRGLFSNEAGMGSAPNAGAAAMVSHPVKQGFVQMISVYIDTLIICTTTAMMLLVYGIHDNLTGIPYVQAAVQSKVGEIGILFIVISIIFFAFSSIVGNYCYAESNLKFINNSKTALLVFRISCLVAIVIGAVASFDMVWHMADVLMGFMALVNVIAIILLHDKAIKALKDYKRQKKKGQDPVFVAKEVGITDTECWEEE